MADNSVDLVCRACGAWMPLAKIYYSTRETFWYFSSSYEDKGKELDEFLEQHTHCYDNEELELSANDRRDFEYRPFKLKYEHDISYEHGSETVTDEEIAEDAARAWYRYHDKSIPINEYNKKMYTDGFADGVKWFARKLAVMPKEKAFECVAELGKL